MIINKLNRVINVTFTFFIFFIFFIFFVVSCANQSQIHKNKTEEMNDQNFHLYYTGHCEKNGQNSKDERPMGVQVSHPGLKELITEDHCRIIRLNQAISSQPHFCSQISSKELSKEECFELKFREMMDQAPLTETGNLIALGAGLFFISQNSKDPYTYAFSVAHFTLLILESISNPPPYQSLFPDLKVKTLSDIPINQWKNYHPQLTTESSFARDDEFIFFLLYSRLFADNFAYEMLDKLRHTLHYLESIPISSEREKQEQLFSLLKRYHSLREHFITRSKEVCDADIASGCNQVGGSYLKSPSEIDQSLPYLTRSCTLLDGIGCGVLGDYYQSQNDLTNALRYYTLGCLHNNSPSCNMAGNLHYKKNEYEMAKKFYETAKENGDEMASLFLKAITRKGVKGKVAPSFSGLVGKWKGTYKCGQGETKVTFTIMKNQTASFLFNKDEQFIGSFKGKIQMSHGTLYFTPDSNNIDHKIKGDLESWITIGFSAEIFSETLVGRINNSSCEMIYIEKEG